MRLSRKGGSGHKKEMTGAVMGGGRKIERKGHSSRGKGKRLLERNNRKLNQWRRKKDMSVGHGTMEEKKDLIGVILQKIRRMGRAEARKGRVTHPGKREKSLRGALGSQKREGSRDEGWDGEKRQAVRMERIEESKRQEKANTSRGG